MLKYWMWLSCLTSLRPKAKNLALEHFDSIDELFFADEGNLKQIEGLTPRDVELLSNKNMAYAMKSLEICAENNVEIMAITDSRYPSRLRNMYDPPVVLFIMGNLPDMDDEAAIGVVGTRKATPYGIKMATNLGYEITRGGGLIVSGLAEGIDSAAAVGALRASGRCVGVLGTGINEVYPRFNGRLFEDVKKLGAIISEYPPNSPYSPSNFPMRNRIISGLSVGVLVIEAPMKSGALITAERATEQGRDVFVLPGNVDAPSCAGSNSLLRDFAKPVMSGEDVLCEYEGLFPHRIKSFRQKTMVEVSQYREEIDEVKNKKSSVKTTSNQENSKKEIDNGKDVEYIDIKKLLEDLNERQLEIVTILSNGEKYADEIIEITGISASDVMSELTMLEILGIITSEGFNKYRINIKMKRGTLYGESKD